MAMRRNPQHNMIVRANLPLLQTLPNIDPPKEPATDNDIRELERTCWACGHFSSEHKATRAHVVARSRGGTDDPSNYFLLCDVCHEEQPDGLSRELQEQWLKNRDDWFKRYYELINELFEDMTKTQNGISREHINQWMCDSGSKYIVSLIQQGYKSAAGFKNGRANCFMLFRQDFTQWLNDADRRSIG